MALKNEILEAALQSPLRPKDKISRYARLKISDADILALQKLDTNQTQNEHNTNTKLNTNSYTNQTQTEHVKKEVPFLQNTKQTQTRHANQHKSTHKVTTKQIQTEHNEALLLPFSSFVGIQRALLFFFYQNCKVQRTKTTQELSLIHIANSLNIRVGSVKTSIVRLEEKGAIVRCEFKNGRSGWSRYELKESIYREIFQYETEHKLYTNQTQSLHKPHTELNTKIDTTAVSSSSEGNITLRTTTTALPEAWEMFDLSEYAQNFGFTRVQLKQLYEKEIPLDAIQQSLIEMNYDVTTNQLGKIHSSPVNMLMGLLRAGKQYASSHYQSEFEKIKKEMTERIAQRNKADLENCFLIWLEKTDKAEIKKIIYTMTRSLSFENVYEAVGIQDKEIRGILLNYYTQIHKDYVLSLKRELQKTSVDNT